MTLNQIYSVLGAAITLGYVALMALIAVATVYMIGSMTTGWPA